MRVEPAWFSRIAVVVLAIVACSSSRQGSSGGAAASGAGGSAAVAGANGVSGSGSGGGASAAGGAGGSAAGAGGGACTDTCPAPNGGVTWSCEKRFMYGVNYAWKAFAGDFGGVPSWGQSGVSGNVSAISADLADMHAHGASVIRWWMFPDFRGAGVTFDASDTPTGLGGTAVADIQKALELAQQNDVYLMFTLFSFDGFRPTADNHGIHVPSIAPIVTDATRRAALMDVVRQVAQTVAASPDANRMIAWDVINEPEWAISGSDPYGDPPFTPTSSLDSVTFAQMQTFIEQTVGVLHSQSSALVTVGGAAAKWAKDWTQVGVDFYSLHIYDWVDNGWPYTNPPSTYGLGKPIVMQEMAFNGLNGTSFATVVQSFWDTGYAGALPWAWDGATDANKTALQTFASQHSCETNYSQSSPLVILPRAPRSASRVSHPRVIPSLRICHRTADGVPDCSAP